MAFTFNFGGFTPGGFGGFFEVQLAANGNAEYVDPRFLAPGNQCFERLLGGHADGLGGVGAAEVLLIKVVECFPAGNSCLLHQTDSVCFCCHSITAAYYTTVFLCFQE